MSTRQPPDGNKTVTTLRLPNDLRARLDEEGRRQDLNRTSMVIRLLRQALDKIEENELQNTDENVQENAELA